MKYTFASDKSRALEPRASLPIKAVRVEEPCNETREPARARSSRGLGSATELQLSEKVNRRWVPTC